MRYSVLISLFFAAIFTAGAESGSEPAPIPGVLIFHRGALIPDAVAEKFVGLAGGTKASILLITSDDAVAGETEKITASLVKNGAAVSLRRIKQAVKGQGDASDVSGYT